MPKINPITARTVSWVRTTQRHCAGVRPSARKIARSCERRRTAVANACPTAPRASSARKAPSTIGRTRTWCRARHFGQRVRRIEGEVGQLGVGLRECAHERRACARRSCVRTPGDRLNFLRSFLAEIRLALWFVSEVCSCVSELCPEPGLRTGSGRKREPGSTPAADARSPCVGQSRSRPSAETSARASWRARMRRGVSHASEGEGCRAGGLLQSLRGQHGELEDDVGSTDVQQGGAAPWGAQTWTLSSPRLSTLRTSAPDGASLAPIVWNVAAALSPRLSAASRQRPAGSKPEVGPDRRRRQRCRGWVAA
jgi:hypothetical protein